MWGRGETFPTDLPFEAALIGLAAAKRFIEEGAFVFIFGRRQEALDAAVVELGPNARAEKGSVSNEADLDRLYAAVMA
jgi:NAD(P)-dependent dehydrogenase (short-subunit alcohol dehydrogenase family)